MKIAEHFTIRELTNTSLTECHAENIYFALDNFNELVRLAQFCEKVRQIIGAPMNVTSAVRYSALNEKVGGVSSSDHCKFLAVDFIPVKLKLQTAFDKIRNSSLDFKQLIIENNAWIHVSIGDKRECLKYEAGKYTKVQ